MNRDLEEVYGLLKNQISLRQNNNMPVEYNLFHGTSFENILNICERGFNRSYSGFNRTVYGKGVYFARKAGYSHNYSKKSLPEHGKKTNIS